MPGISLSLLVAIERWPLAQAFTISRGSKTEAITVTVELSDGKHKGRGECVPYARYGETPESVKNAIDAMKDQLAAGLDRRALQSAMPPGAARNALDCAYWDLKAKQSGRRLHEIAGLPAPKSLPTAFTLSLDTPEAMAAAAVKAVHWPLLKLKLGRDDDAARLTAVRQAAPHAELIVDANEGWSPDNLAANFAACAKVGVIVIEQPLPEVNDVALAHISRPVPVCADESVHGLASMKNMTGKYDAVNIKLDKAGGLTEALAMVDAAAHMGLSVMAGCMVATSLAIAPALFYAQKARVVDLDGPLWLAKDRPDGLRYDGSRVHPPTSALFG